MSGEVGEAGEQLELVFIGGTGRSGTHVLADLLGRHSRFASVPIEARFHCNKRGLPDLLEGRVTLRAFIDKLRGFWWHRVRVDGRPRGLYNLLRTAELEAAVERFEVRFADHPLPASRRLFAELLGGVAARSGKPGLVEMSSQNVRQAQTLLRLFPEARFIHALRDGRDAAASVRGKTWGPDSVVAAIDWWAARLRAIEEGVRGSEDGASYAIPPERFHVVELEDLVAWDRERCYAELLEFLGVEDEPAIASRFGRMTPEAAHIGRWQRGIGRVGRARVRRRYERALGALAGEGNHAAGPLLAAYERDRGGDEAPSGGLGGICPPNPPSAGARLRVSRGRATRRILFVTSNGTGLGHLSRAMAIARRLPGSVESAFVTLSQAAPAAARAGFGVEYFPAYRLPGSGSDWQWNMRLRRRLEEILAELRPDLVVFDGVHPYRGLTHVLTAAGAPRAIWCRRPLWREGSRAAALRRTGAFDAVLEPGELAAREDRGPTVAHRAEVTNVAPIIYLDPGELLDREAARSELGLPAEGWAALVALGQGGEVSRAVARALRRLAAEPGLTLAVLESSLSPGLELPKGVRPIRGRFPIARLYRAFDLVIAAAGYNAFHELVAYGVPTLFVPMPRETDDQPARARWAERAGVALAVERAGDPRLEEKIGELLDPGTRRRLAVAAVEAVPSNGAQIAARLVAAGAGGERVGPRVRRPGRLHRWLNHSSHPVGPSLPLTVVLTARDLIRHPERRRPQAVILGLGVAEEELAERLDAALGDLEAEPGRVLVVTDALELAPLRRAGVGIERIPRREEALRLGIAEERYGDYAAGRLESILRDRGLSRSETVELTG